MRSACRIAALALTLGAVGALLFASTSLAGQAVTQTLNPSPLPFQTCGAVGAGTICEGRISFTYSLQSQGLTCGTGATAYDILDSATLSVVAISFYDANGNLLRRERQLRWTSGQNTNSLTGATLDYRQHSTWTDVLATPGDFGSATTTLTGELVVRGSDGGPILIGAGRTDFGPGFIVEFQAGPSGFVDLLLGDQSAIDRLCAALSAT